MREDARDGGAGRTRLRSSSHDWHGTSEGRGIASRSPSGLGLATPGPFAVAGLSPPRLPGWDGVVLRDLLKQATGLPVSLANDGQCAVTAEWRFGDVARRLTNFVYVYVGIGPRQRRDDPQRRLWRGKRQCGRVRPYHRGARRPSLYLRQAGLPRDLRLGRCSDALLVRARAGDRIDGAVQRCELCLSPGRRRRGSRKASEPLRVGINTIENLFDPQTIMLGGNAPLWLIEAFFERMEPLYPSVGRTDRDLPRLIKAELGHDAVARGAAALPVLSKLNPQYQHLNAINTQARTEAASALAHP